MFDREYFKQVDSEMLGALKVLGRAMLSALDDPAPVRRRGAYKNRHCAEDMLY